MLQGNNMQVIQYSKIHDPKYKLLVDHVSHKTPVWQVAIIVFSIVFFASKVLQLW